MLHKLNETLYTEKQSNKKILDKRRRAMKKTITKIIRQIRHGNVEY
jgi:hypothetical protein